MTYGTQVELEQYLQIDFLNDPDPVVDTLRGYAKAVIDSVIGRTLEAEAGISETLDGKTDRILFLSKWPVTAVGSVTEDGIALTEDVDFVWYDDGRLVRGSLDYDWRWTHKRKGVVVSYDAGYATIPTDVSLVATRIAGRLFQAGAAYASIPASASGIRSISLDGSDQVEYSELAADVSRGLAGLDSVDREILRRYTRYDF